MNYTMNLYKNCSSILLWTYKNQIHQLRIVKSDFTMKWITNIINKLQIYFMNLFTNLHGYTIQYQVYINKFLYMYTYKQIILNII